jgi:hypothetical protein
MKTFLMYKDRDFNLQQKLPANEEALMQDLELETLFNAMALGDAFLFEVAKKAVVGGMNTDLETIRYRQRILSHSQGHLPDSHRIDEKQKKTLV